MESESQNISPPVKNKRSIVPKLILVAVVAGVLGLWFVAIRAGRPGLPNSPRLNKPAPAFTLHDMITGKSIALADLRGRPVLINFWASWCVSCREEAPVLEALYRDLEPKGVKVLGIAIQDRQEDAMRFMKKYGQSFQSLLDPPGSVAVDYGVLGVPETFIIDPQGVVVERIIGVITEARVYKALQQMEWQGRPTTGVTR